MTTTPPFQPQPGSWVALSIAAPQRPKEKAWYCGPMQNPAFSAVERERDGALIFCTTSLLSPWKEDPPVTPATKLEALAGEIDGWFYANQVKTPHVWATTLRSIAQSIGEAQEPHDTGQAVADWTFEERKGACAIMAEAYGADKLADMIRDLHPPAPQPTPAIDEEAERKGFEAELPEGYYPAWDDEKKCYVYSSTQLVWRYYLTRAKLAAAQAEGDRRVREEVATGLVELASQQYAVSGRAADKLRALATKLGGGEGR